MAAGRVSGGNQPSAAPFGAGCARLIAAWRESDGWQLKKVCGLSRELRVNRFKGVTHLASPLPGWESSGSGMSNQGPWESSCSPSIFFQPGFPSFPTRAETECPQNHDTESGGEHRGEFPWISQFPARAASRPAAETALAQHWYHMSEGEGRSRLSPGSRPGEQMAVRRH